MWQNDNQLHLIGYEVIVLSGIRNTWPVSWWYWLVVGVILLMLIICATRAALGAAGIIAEERPIRYVSTETVKLAG